MARLGFIEESETESLGERTDRPTLMVWRSIKLKAMAPHQVSRQFRESSTYSKKL